LNLSVIQNDVPTIPLSDSENPNSTGCNPAQLFENQSSFFFFEMGTSVAMFKTNMTKKNEECEMKLVRKKQFIDK